jgi:16S rRNA (guanine527-N7)-methyltransferase
MNRLKPLFPQITPAQWETLERMAALHREWNEKINLVSRKDIENLEWHHYAPCIAAANFLRLSPQARLLDAGTGGGFPGLILAVLYPDAEFTLADSVGKKITVVADIAARLELKNVRALNVRVETLKRDYDFVTGRAVASLQQFIAWVRGALRRGARHSLENGVIYWQGGALDIEKRTLGIEPTTVLSLEALLGDPHFFEKHILHYRVADL